MKDLFPEFKPSGAAEWKARIERDLKGEPFERLIWRNENGFDIQPFYTAEDLQAEYHPAFHHAEWDVCAYSAASGADEMNRELLSQLDKGATAISVKLDGRAPAEVLHGIRLDYISSTFFCAENELDALSAYLKKNYQGTHLRLAVFPAAEHTQEIGSWIRACKNLHASGARSTCIDALPWLHAGALPYYEVALAFACLAEWLEEHEKTRIAVNNAVTIRTGIDGNLFLQVAKLRAMRRLWEIIKKEFKVGNGLHIIAETALSNKSISDPYNNLIRTTVEAFAAVAGGCNELVVHGFDVFSGNDSTAAKRLSLNQQHILREESYMDKVADVSCGSYYIESLTDAIAGRALETFKELMQTGGYHSNVESGLIAAEIAKHFALAEKRVRSDEQVIVGVNKFRSGKEQPPANGSIAGKLKKQGIRSAVVEYETDQNLKKA